MSVSPKRPNRTWAWIIGSTLVVFGLALLVGNLANLNISGGWWGLFIILPGIALLVHAFRTYQESGNQFTPRARSSALGGLGAIAIGVIFLLNLNWGVIWPVFVILAGIGALLQGATRRI